jgi:hypothetical protein
MIFDDFHGWSNLSTISFRTFQLLLHIYIMDNRNVFYLSIGLFFVSWLWRRRRTGTQKMHR